MQQLLQQLRYSRFYFLLSTCSSNNSTTSSCVAAAAAPLLVQQSCTWPNGPCITAVAAALLQQQRYIELWYYSCSSAAALQPQINQYCCCVAAARPRCKAPGPAVCPAGPLGPCVTAPKVLYREEWYCSCSNAAALHRVIIPLALGPLGPGPLARKGHVIDAQEW